MKEKIILEKLLINQNMSFDEAKWLMHQIMDGTLEPVMVGAILTSLRQKGESIEEITACAEVMREKAVKIHCKKENLIDTVGTGDGSNTFNISTTTAFVVAAAGHHVAKHGNRSSTSQSGSADVLEALGYPINLEADKVAKCIDQVGIGFLFAPVFHRAMKNVVPIRKSLKVRTIFNILGPLTNPAQAQNQIIGVFTKEYVIPMINVLKNLGSHSAFVVAGYDGLDEVTNCDLTFIAQLNKTGEIKSYDFNPETYHFKIRDKAEIMGGDPNENAQITKNILAGKMHDSAVEEIVILNAGFALSALENIDLKTSFEKAKHILHSGKAMEKLNALIHYSQN